MKEMEVKVLNINKKDLEKKLISIGAKLVKREYQINTIFDTEDRLVKNAHKGYLRIRENKNLLTDNTEYIFTLKKNISKNELRENIEIETKVENKEALINILAHLNLTVKHEGTKERISYKYDDILFEIDTWNKETYPDPYLEIEVIKKEDLDKAIDLLNLDRKNVTSKSLEQLRNEIGFGNL